MTILTAVDGGTTPSRAVERGAELASVFGVEHVVLHVMPQERFEEFRESTGGSPGGSLTSSISYGGGTSPTNVEEYTIEDGERHATGVARDVVHATLDDPSDTVLVGRVGDPVEEILAEADRRSVRYLVIGGRKRTPVGKAVFGSKTQSILLTADQPVVTVMSES
jgi:nucleotide-binding universal stress UspA family protein